MLKEISGNTQGIKDSILSEIRNIYNMRCDGEFITMDIATEIAKYTQKISREIALYIKRDGEIHEIIIGTANTASLIGQRITRNSDRLCGLRCIHTHPSGGATLSQADINSLKTLKLDCISAIGVRNGLPVSISAGFLLNEYDREQKEYKVVVELSEIFVMHKMPSTAWLNLIDRADDSFKSSTVLTKEIHNKNAIIVGIQTGAEKYDTLKELKKLAETAAINVIDIVSQNKEQTDKNYFVGKGKLDEIIQKYGQTIDYFIFDDELSSNQLYNLEQKLGGKAIDRTTLILDIFAMRAQSYEGKLQVELAQLKYRLPRFAGAGKTLSRAGGGIGTRGLGETKVELGKREVKRRIFELENMIREVEKQRNIKRARREKNSVPTVALVGYTNAGKSTLLNQLSGSNVYAQDQLFATLDPVVRSIVLPSGDKVLISDTVGFINKLPHDLVKAFKSTLEETAYADLIVHVVDASSDYYREQINVVENVLQSIGAGNKPTIMVYNKSDKIDDQPNDLALHISAKYGKNIDLLIQKIQERLNMNKKNIDLQIPYSRTDVAAYLHQKANVIEEQYDPECIKMNVTIDNATLNSIKKMLKTQKANECEYLQ